MGARLWAFEDSYVSVPMDESSWRRRNDRPVWDDNSGLKKIGYKDEPFVLAKDVTQVFYVKDMVSKPKKNQGKSNDEPKRHIVLPGKRKIIGVEDISDKSEDFDQFDDRPPFSVDVDPSILLSKKDTPYLRRDHNQGMFVTRKVINVPLNNDES